MSQDRRLLVWSLVVIAAAALVLVMKGTPGTVAKAFLIVVVTVGVIVLIWTALPIRVLRRDFDAWRNARRTSAFKAQWKVGVVHGFGERSIYLEAPDPNGQILAFAVNRAGAANPYEGAIVCCGIHLPTGETVWADGVDFPWGIASIVLPDGFPSWPTEPREVPGGKYRVTWTVRFPDESQPPVSMARRYETNRNGVLVEPRSRWYRTRARVRYHWDHLRGRGDD